MVTLRESNWPTGGASFPQTDQDQCRCDRVAAQALLRLCERINHNGRVRISAKADYAVRAALELAAAEDPPIKAERVADAQGIPLKFLENILVDLRQAGLVTSQRGPAGGYRLDRPAEDITLADVVRAVDGPLASIHGDRPEATEYRGAAEELQTVWVALRASMRVVLEGVTLAEVVERRVPGEVLSLAREPDAWMRR
jgi:Rrf2 family protein